MTIAALYVSPEGVVLGADSTSSFFSGQSTHFYNFAQKLFEVGDGGTLGLLTWGMGGLGHISYRTTLAKLGDDLVANPPLSVDEVAQRWAAMFDALYQQLPEVVRATTLMKRAPHDAQKPDDPDTRTAQEEEDLPALSNSLVVGFCIAGYVMPDRGPDARVVVFAPGGGPSITTPLHNQLHCWGMPNVMNRLLYGVDDGIVNSIVSSGKWNDTPDQLIQILEAHRLQPRVYLPLRDAVDYVHSAIYCTIKAMKFSTHLQVCGGPIEVAVVSSDRRFRWVRHKEWDAAITEGEI